MVAPWQVLAEAGAKPGLQEWRQQLLWAGPLLAGVLLLVALVIAWVKRWSQRPTPTRPPSGDQLAHFRTLYEQGEISAEEFSRLRTLLTERLRNEVEPPGGPPPEARAPQPAPPGNGVKPNGAGPAP